MKVINKIIINKDICKQDRHFILLQCTSFSSESKKVKHIYVEGDGIKRKIEDDR